MEILILIILTMLNGLFSMSETALVSSRKIRLERLAKHGNRRAMVTLNLANHPHRFLSTVQVGITLLGILMGAYGSANLAEDFQAFFFRFPLVRDYSDFIGYTLMIALTTYLSLVIGELVPKSIALNKPEKVAVILTPLMNTLSIIAMPVVSFLENSTKLLLKIFRIRATDDPPVTEEELKHLIEQGRQYGILEQQESDMMRSIFRTADRNVNTLMTHRKDIVWIDLNSTPQEIQKTIEQSVHTNFPVCNNSLDNIVGIVSIKDILVQLSRKKELNIRELIRQPLYVPESMPALELLETFRKSGMHVSLVVNEYGSLEGIVTLHDVVESIFGSIPVTQEQTDKEAVRRSDGSWLIDGMMQTHEWSELLNLQDLTDEETGNYNTLGGFMLHHLGRIPQAADHFLFRNHHFEVMDMDGKRVDKVLVKKVEQPK